MLGQPTDLRRAGGVSPLIPHQSPFVREPGQERQAGISGIRLVGHQVMQQRQRILLHQPLSRARQLRADFRCRIGTGQLRQPFQHFVRDERRFTDEPDRPDAHPRALVREQLVGEMLVEPADGV